MPTHICRSFLLPGIVRSALVMKYLLAALILLMAWLCEPFKEILIKLLHIHGHLVTGRAAMFCLMI